MRTAVRVRLGALVAGAALGGLALVGQASAAPSYGPAYSPTPITVNVPGFISIDGLGGPVGFGSVAPGNSATAPLVQTIKTNNPTGYNFTADWTGFTGPTGATPPVLSLKVTAAPSDADFTGPPPSVYGPPPGTFAPVPVGSSQIAAVHRQALPGGDLFADTAQVTVDNGTTAGDYAGTLTFTVVSLP